MTVQSESLRRNPANARELRNEDEESLDLAQVRQGTPNDDA
jgi:hypothetical protein